MSRLNSTKQSSPRQSRGGVCRYCRCTENNACVLSLADLRAILPRLSLADLRLSVVKPNNIGIAPHKHGHRHFTCFWINQQKTVCSNPRCVRKHQLHLRAVKLQRRTRVRNGRQLGFNQRRPS